MFWADKIVEQIINSNNYIPYHVDDMKTPSGKVHVGALRGVMVHDFVYKALLSKNRQAKYTYIFNDMDSMDGLPNYLDQEQYSQYMGFPLFKIPAPEGNKSFAQYYADDFIQTIDKIGASPEILFSHELYQSGKMDKAIKLALDNAQKIKQVYIKIANYQLPKDWLPFQPICEKCGKIGTTTSYAWDGKEVSYRCELNKVKWAQGCGYEGKVSPFGGTGKFLWKVDWPAHWYSLGITIEGAGKDHSSAGGSRDMAVGILKKVFDYPNPFDIPYEWLHIKGAKMSSSKGIGTSASEFISIFPPNIARFLFARTHYNRVLDFDPMGDTIPNLFDEYDRCANNFFNNVNDDFARIYEVSQIGEVPKDDYFRPRFRDVAKYLQMPNIDIKVKFTEEKGSDLTDFEQQILTERIKYARIWLDKYAVKDKVLVITDEIPASTKDFSQDQKLYLQRIVDLLDSGDISDHEEMQQTLYQLSKDMNISPKKAFGTIYLSLFNKKFGPKAGGLLLSLPKSTLIKRFKQIISQ